MTVNLSRNTAISIQNITSQNSSVVSVAGGFDGAAVGPVRNASSSGYLLDSTQLWIELPVASNDKVGFVVSWAGTQQETAGSLYLNVAAGDHWRNTLGAYNLLLTNSTEVTGGSTRCQIKRWFIGPFESAQFVKAAASSAAGATVGDPVIRFGLSTALATAALTTQERHKVHIQAFKMPSVDYDT